MASISPQSTPLGGPDAKLSFLYLLSFNRSRAETFLHTLILNIISKWGSKAQWLAHLFPVLAALDSNQGPVAFIQRKFSDVAVLIHSTQLKRWTVKNLIKLIKPIQ